ncbi:MAG: hypothetical protein AAF639_19105 [Chloroflexota bacterium]
MLANLRQIIRGKRRPQHLGKYRMEMVKRVPKTTTRITDDVPRMPKRANFFMRAFHGDMGPKVKAQFPNFVAKYPLSNVMRKIVATQLPNHKGEPNPEKAPIPDDLQERANHLKSLSYFMGADIVGICEVSEYYSTCEFRLSMPGYHRFQNRINHHLLQNVQSAFDRWYRLS